MKLLILAVLLSLGVVAYGTEVDKNCIECLCEGSTRNCDRNAGCDSYGFCGPFRISKHYWEEAGSFENDFEKCAKNYNCAERTVKEYMKKYGKDCDGDGDVDCLDYALIHHKGRNGCPYTDYQSDSLYKYVDDCLKKKSPSQQQQQQTTSSQVQPSLGEDISQVHKNIQQGGSNVGESAQGQMRNFQEQGQQLGQRAQGQAENVGENIKGSLSQAKDYVKDKFQGAKENIQDTARNVQEGFQDKFHQAAGDVQSEQQKLNEQLQKQQQQQGFQQQRDQLASQLQSRLPDEHQQASLMSGEKSHQSLPMTSAAERHSDKASGGDSDSSNVQDPQQRQQEQQRSGASSISDMIKSRRRRGIIGL